MLRIPLQNLHCKPVCLCFASHKRMKAYHVLEITNFHHCLAHPIRGLQSELHRGLTPIRSHRGGSTTVYFLDTELHSMTVTSGF